jgi:hypothetical protein
VPVKLAFSPVAFLDEGDGVVVELGELDLELGSLLGILRGCAIVVCSGCFEFGSVPFGLLEGVFRVLEELAAGPGDGLAELLGAGELVEGLLAGAGFVGDAFSVGEFAGGAFGIGAEFLSSVPLLGLGVDRWF